MFIKSMEDILLFIIIYIEIWSVLLRIRCELEMWCRIQDIYFQAARYRK